MDGKRVPKILGWSFLLVFFGVTAWTNKPHLPPEEIYNKLKNFVDSFPSSFVAQVSSPEISVDIQKIPKVYIKDSSKSPRLLLSFSKEWGVKIWMDNVAKGISKQYTAIGDGFKAFFPFLKAKSLQDFQKQFTIEGNSYSAITIRDNMNTKGLFYIFQIDNAGEIRSVKESVGGKISTLVQFFYRKIDGYTTVDRLFVDRLVDPIRRYRFRIDNYDTHADLSKEDFLG